jgi:hypothetical protein
LSLERVGGYLKKNVQFLRSVFANNTSILLVKIINYIMATYLVS